MLDKYLRQFDDCFGRIEPVERLKAYVTGQLSDLQRKSIEPMADAAGLPPRNLQQFLSLNKWDEMHMCDTLEQIVANEHQHPYSIGTFDETGHSKKGDKTPGVQRQWCGNTGKTDDCVVTVHLSYTAGGFHCLLDGELFLPESWSQDRDRCKAAGIPEQMTYPSGRLLLSCGNVLWLMVFVSSGSGPMKAMAKCLNFFSGLTIAAKDMW
jgi:SRSO17 transposase